jgi:hypothetical protein
MRRVAGHAALAWVLSAWDSLGSCAWRLVYAPAQPRSRTPWLRPPQRNSTRCVVCAWSVGPTASRSMTSKADYMHHQFLESGAAQVGPS